MIIGIGNSCYDLFFESNKDLIKEYGLNYASAELVDKQITEDIIDKIGKPVLRAAGGSVANSIVGLAKNNIGCGLIGKVANDAFGREYKTDLVNAGVDDFVNQIDEGDTARCLCLITDEGGSKERSMATYLGVAGNLSEDDIDEDIIKKADIIFLEGYLVFSAKDALLKALKVAKENNIKVAFSLSAVFCIDVMTDLVLQICNESDIIFGNEEEWELLYNKGFEAGSQVVVETMSERGAKVKTTNFEVVVPAEKVDNIVDVTGAGDAFAAGFLAKYYNNDNLKIAAEFGNKLAGQVIQKIGGRV